MPMMVDGWWRKPTTKDQDVTADRLVVPSSDGM
jgi:hypothetical protein